LRNPPFLGVKIFWTPPFFRVKKFQPPYIFSNPPTRVFMNTP
jgi:hypothetical protein